MKGNNTYQIVYTGNSSSRRLRLLDVAMDGAGVRSVSLSGSDFNAGMGEKSADSGSCFGDAYDLYVHYQHKGDHKKAYQALRAMMPRNEDYSDFDFHQTPQIETYDNDKGVTVVSEQEFINSLDIPDPIIDGVISRGRSYSLTAKTGHSSQLFAGWCHSGSLNALNRPGVGFEWLRRGRTQVNLPRFNY